MYSNFLNYVLSPSLQFSFQSSFRVILSVFHDSTQISGVILSDSDDLETSLASQSMWNSSLFLLTCLCTLLGSCSISEAEMREQLLDQMLGSWEFTGTEIVEEWSRDPEGGYHIDVISHAGWEPDTVQYIDLKEGAEGMYYKGQILRDHNSTRPIDFKSVEISTEHILFENENQEFPKHIRYMLIHENKIRIRISGTQDGKYREQDFVYYRKGSQ